MVEFVDEDRVPLRRGGRRSAASMVAAIPGERPEPPGRLNDEEAAEWRAIVNRMPSDWFPRETHGILETLCVHICCLRVLAVQLRGFDVRRLRTENGAKIYDRLTKMHERETRIVLSCATKLRCTTQSRYDEKKAATAVKNAPTILPWELGKVRRVRDQ